MSSPRQAPQACRGACKVLLLFTQHPKWRVEAHRHTSLLLAMPAAPRRALAALALLTISSLALAQNGEQRSRLASCTPAHRSPGSGPTCLTSSCPRGPPLLQSQRPALTVSRAPAARCARRTQPAPPPLAPPPPRARSSWPSAPRPPSRPLPATCQQPTLWAACWSSAACWCSAPLRRPSARSASK